MKKIAFVIASVLVSVSAFADYCSIQSFSGVFDVYQGENFVKRFDSVRDAAILKNQLTKAKVCN